MKLLKIAVLSLLCASAFTACKKDKDNGTITNTSDIAGNWVGKYGNGSDVPNIYYAFIIKSNGTLDEVNKYGVKIGEGTWTISGNKFLATAHYLANPSGGFSVNATLSGDKINLTGTWGYGNNASDGGTFYMHKQGK